MAGTENNIWNQLLSDDAIPENLKAQLSKEFQRMEKYAALLELQLKVKGEEINILNQTIATLRTENKINDHLLQEEDIGIFNNINENQPDEKFERPTSKNKRGNRVPNAWKKFKFLMIEDNRADIILLKSIFKLWGLHLDIASSIKEAKEKMQQKYDCILSDVMLPDGDGLGHILELRLNDKSVNQNTAVIIITAKASRGGARAAQLANVQCYFNKPFSLKHLKKGLEQIFEEKKKSDKISTEVVLDSKDSWTWFDILNHNLNGRYHLMEEFMAIFLDQAKYVIKLLSTPIQEENLELIQYKVYKFQSTVNTIGLKDSYNLVSKISQEIMVKSGKCDLNKLVNPCILQLKKDIAKVEMQIN
ncbi:MAG: response regulator [Bacteroidota bacterium]